MPVRSGTDTPYGEPGTEKWYIRLGRSVAKINRWNVRTGEETMRVTEIKIRLSGSEWDESMVMVKGVDSDGPIICFASHIDPAEAFRVALEKVDNATAEWREDGWPTRAQQQGLRGFGMAEKANQEEPG
jgi:hypothetical protein